MRLLFLLRLLYCFFWIFVLIMPFSVVQAQEKSSQLFQTQVSYYVDEAGKLGVEEVQRKPFIPTQIPFSRGYTPTTTWVKVDIAPNASPHLVLSVQPTFLDDVRLYRFTEGVGWSFEQMGDHFAFSERVRKERVFSFNITPNPQIASTFFVRIATTSASLIDITVQSEADSTTADNSMHFLIGIYAGLLFALMAVSLWHFIKSREILWGISFLFQLTSLLIAIGHMGFAAKYLLPHYPLWADAWVSIVAVTHLATTMLFLYKLAKFYQPHRWILWVLFPLGYIWPVLAFAGIAFGKVQLVMSLTTLTVLIAPIFNTIALYFVDPVDKIVRYLLRGIPTLLTAYLFYFAAPFFGLCAMSNFHLSPPILTNLLIALLHISILFRCDYLKKKIMIKSVVDAEKTKQELALEKASRAAEAIFLSMLLHEIKTPMTTMRLAIMTLTSGRLTDPAKQDVRIQSIQKAIDSMDAILERTKETDTLDQNKIHINISRCDVALVIQEIIQSNESSQRLKAELPKHCMVNVDGILLNMMLNNLIQNAIMYSSKDSLIDIELDLMQSNQLKITVYNWVDSGCLPDVLMIFQKYYRSDHARQFTGTGLGLYWVKGVARRLGGDLLYRNEGGNRVIFELRLPC